MQRRAWTALLALGCILLAGCAGQEPPAPPGPGPSTSSATTVQPPSGPGELVLLREFALQGCQGTSIEAARDVADVQALLPTGFVAATDGGNGIVRAELWTCGNLTTPSTRTTDVWWGRMSIPVQRPDHVPGAPDGGSHGYVLRILSSPGPVEQVWRTAGFDVAAGNGSFQRTAIGDTLQVVTASLDGYILSAQATSALAGPAGTGFAWYAVHPEGDVLRLTGQQQMPAPPSGVGRATVPADDPAHGLAGPTGDLEGSSVVGAGVSWVGMDLVRVRPA